MVQGRLGSRRIAVVPHDGSEQSLVRRAGSLFSSLSKHDLTELWMVSPEAVSDSVAALANTGPVRFITAREVSSLRSEAVMRKLGLDRGDRQSP